jgi:hypothetical protein
MINVYKILNRQEGKRAVETRKRKWVENIKSCILRKKDMVWIHLAQERDPWLVLVSTEKKSLFS